MEKMLASIATTALAAVNKMSGGDNKSATFKTTNDEPNQLFKSVLNKQVNAQQSAAQQTEAAKVNAKQALNAASHKPTVQKADANQTKVPQDETPSTSVNKSSEDGDQVITQSSSQAEADDADASDHDHDAKSATDEMLALALFSQPLTATIKPDLPANAGELSAQLRSLTATKTENTAQLLSTDTASKTVDGKAVTLTDASNVGLLQANQVSDKVNLDKPDLLTANTHNAFATQLDAAKLQQEAGALAKKTDVELDTNLAAVIASAEKNIPMPATDTLNASQQVASRPVIDAYPGKAGWDQAISQRVIYMAGAGEQSATLTLNPPDLGPLQVVVSVNNGQADASFTSDNPEVRQALQDGMDNLREKMRESGVELGQTNVQSGEQSRQAFEQATQHRSSESRINATQSPAISATDGVSKKVAVKVINGLVDTFA
jgi:flagellar hook-length control protein FliK